MRRFRVQWGKGFFAEFESEEKARHRYNELLQSDEQFLAPVLVEVLEDALESPRAG